MNNLPLRVRVPQGVAVGELVQSVQARLLQLSMYQFTPLIEIQRVSQIPWRHRLFESVVVFQNYAVDDAARRFGADIGISDFVGPIHTRYPVMLVADPAETLRLTLVYDQHSIASDDVERWARDLVLLIEQMPAFLDRPAHELQQQLSEPAQVSPAPARQRPVTPDYVPPQTPMEKTIAAVCERMFELDRVGADESFFDAGGHSLLLIQVHDRLRTELNIEFPIVALFEHPTIAALARYLSRSAETIDMAGQWRQRAERQRHALAQIRSRVTKDLS